MYLTNQQVPLAVRIAMAGGWSQPTRVYKELEDETGTGVERVRGGHARVVDRVVVNAGSSFDQLEEMLNGTA